MTDPPFLYVSYFYFLLNLYSESWTYPNSERRRCTLLHTI